MRNELVWFAAYAGCVASLVMFFAANGIAPLRAGTVWIAKEAQTAAVFFVQSITAVQIQNNYHSVPVANLATATVSTTT
ncbi:MAG: hypothetical protein NUV90_00075, partial [Candidatus Parcubacteria bacterium]|nr:hypothetical protein [Candidatus Parcubacteria bacterium]